MSQSNTKNKRQEKKKQEKELRYVSKEISAEWRYIIQYVAILAMASEYVASVFFANNEASAACNTVGQIAFPLFAFGLVECACFTKKRGRQLLTLGALAAVSELPFDLAFLSNSPFQFTEDLLRVQNVYWTFFIGFALLCILNFDFKPFMRKVGYKKLSGFASGCVKICACGVASVFSILLSTDYSWRGIFLIFLFYFAKNRKHTRLWQAISLLFFIGSAGNSSPYYLSVIFAFALMCVAQCNCKRFAFGERLKQILNSRPSKNICQFFYPIILLALVIGKLLVF